MKPKIYKFNIIEGLRYLSNKELQRYAWFEENDIYFPYIDQVESVFLDSGLEGILDKETIFGKEADQALRELNAMVDAIGYDRDERDLINAPEMEAVRQKAAEALTLILASDGSESTVEIIEE